LLGIIRSALWEVRILTNYSILPSNGFAPQEIGLIRYNNVD
jgi:hypothetical protein